MSRPNLSPKRIATDIAGWACIIASPFLGWLPGPGGIPLFIAGLGLLSINNAWAERLLHWVRQRSENLRDILFPDITWVAWSWDILALGLAGFGTYLSLAIAKDGWLKLLPIPIYSVATIIFLFNRHRLHWIERKLPKRLRKHKK